MKTGELEEVEKSKDDIVGHIRQWRTAVLWERCWSYGSGTVDQYTTSAFGARNNEVPTKKEHFTNSIHT